MKKTCFLGGILSLVGVFAADAGKDGGFVVIAGEEEGEKHVLKRPLDQKLSLLMYYKENAELAVGRACLNKKATEEFEAIQKFFEGKYRRLSGKSLKENAKEKGKKEEGTISIPIAERDHQVGGGQMDTTADFYQAYQKFTNYQKRLKFIDENNEYFQPPKSSIEALQSAISETKSIYQGANKSLLDAVVFCSSLGYEAKISDRIRQLRTDFYESCSNSFVHKVLVETKETDENQDSFVVLYDQYPFVVRFGAYADVRNWMRDHVNKWGQKAAIMSKMLEGRERENCGHTLIELTPYMPRSEEEKEKIK